MPDIGKHKNLPIPVYSTDFYLAAVLRELVALNETMNKIVQSRNTAAKPVETPASNKKNPK